MVVARALEKYCRHYAEAEQRQLGTFPRHHRFSNALVVPAYKEGALFLEGLQALAQESGRTLVILVINQPANDQENDQECDQDQGASLALRNAALESGTAAWRVDPLTLIQWQNQSALLVVDRYSPGLRIPLKQGVGLARKIGNDLAVELFRLGILGARFIHNSDADATLPADYFQQTAELPPASAAVYPFRHIAGDDALGCATRLYEESLHYYVDGLRWAGSPYAFHTIGSCVAVSLQHYCQARGFPRRAGGEDFYLLNKLAKLCRVFSVHGAPITIAARQSSRVPFGTGPAVEKILALGSPDQFHSYDPRVFAELKTLLHSFGGLERQPSGSEHWLAGLSSHLRDACQALQIGKLLDHLEREVHSPVHRRQHIAHWFDGFRTLKLIHYLQDNHYPALPFHRARSMFQTLVRDPLE
ncbi:hypothetical protein ACXYTJ_07600 [Gilvimarinus sp. F26214L]|uniref:hypothetical protein n=1 Tax=Gilvimarinus sp. DZF01 TaxID=3461371 RepID=UPI0040451A89